ENLRLVPSLHECRLLLDDTLDDVVRAWAGAVNPLQEFRQGENVGRNVGGGQPRRPGQSRWPEPAAIRGLFDLPANRQDLTGHAYAVTRDADGRDFPRADLGLPIVFQYLPDPRAPERLLEGSTPGRQRMASPLILKALPLADSGFVALAVQL